MTFGGEGLTVDRVPGAESIKRPTLAVIAAERIRELIIGGHYGPGSQLNEVELAQRFGVSRGPIREALQRLVQEGLLQSEPHRGVFVARLGEADVADIYLARQAVESAAVTVLLERGLAPGNLAGLTRLVDEMGTAARLDDSSRMAELDMQFHMALVNAAGSQRLSRMYATLIDETRICLSLFSASRASRAGLVDEHLELLQQLTSGDSKAALSALADHFTQSVPSLQGYFRGTDSNRPAERR